VSGTLTGSGSFRPFQFELEADANATNDDPLYGLTGRIVAKGIKTYKAIRVGTSDEGVGAGADVIMAISCDVRPNANTTIAHVVQISEQAAGGVSDKVEGIHFDTVNDNRWKNGIAFEQGMEVEGAWIQASITDTGSPNGRFLKLKDDPAADVIFEVDNIGRVRSTDSIHAGPNFINGVKMTGSAIERTAAAGSLSIIAGTDSGKTLDLRAGDTVQITLSDDGVSLGSPPRHGTGTLSPGRL